MVPRGLKLPWWLWLLWLLLPPSDAIINVSMKTVIRDIPPGRAEGRSLCLLTIHEIHDSRQCKCRPFAPREDDQNWPVIGLETKANTQISVAAKWQMWQFQHNGPSYPKMAALYARRSGGTLDLPGTWHGAAECQLHGPRRDCLVGSHGERMSLNMKIWGDLPSGKQT